MNYGIGDKVRIVNYGHNIYTYNKKDGTKTVDLSPDIVGKEGIVSKAIRTRDTPQYAIDGLHGKHAWFSEDQMEMISRNPNRQ